MQAKTSKKLCVLASVFVLSLASCQQKKGPENSSGYYHNKYWDAHNECDVAVIGYKTDGQWYDYDSDIPYTLAIANLGISDEYYDAYVENTLHKILVYCTTDVELYRNLNNVDYVLSMFEDENEKYKHLEDEGGWLLNEFEPADFYSEAFGFSRENNIMTYNFEEDIYLTKEIINSYQEKVFDFTTNGIYITVVTLRRLDYNPSKYTLRRDTRRIELKEDWDNRLIKIQTEY